MTDAAVDLRDAEGVDVVPGDYLSPLVYRVRLNGSEWRIVVAVLLSEPVTARRLARALKLDYALVKRTVRGLIGWCILAPTPDGLRFQPDATRWRSPS